MKNKLLAVTNLNKGYGEEPKKKQVLRDFSCDLEKGETIGIVGESGCGKSTLARIIVGLEKAEKGEVLYNGRNILTMSAKEIKEIRPLLQLVFQNYRKALNPYVSVKKILEEAAPGENYGELLSEVGLDPILLNKYARQLSGGQAQRLNLIRAIAMKPQLLILDEATSGLDEETISEMLIVLKKVQAETGMGIIIISHDLKVVEKACTRIIEM